jgi:hypothetical protein
MKCTISDLYLPKGSARSLDIDQNVDVEPEDGEPIKAMAAL